MDSLSGVHGRALYFPSVCAWGREGAERTKERGFLSPHRMGSWEGQKTTYGRSSKKPTVGRSTDLPWVAKTTYSRFYLGGIRRFCLDGLESGFEDRACIPSKGSDFLGGGNGWQASCFQGADRFSLPLRRGSRTAVALGGGVCIGAKLMGAFGGLRNYYYLCSAQAESRAVHGGCSSVG